MPFQPVARRSLTDEVFDQLVDGIVRGELPVGEPLPSERHLADALGVSRPAVREAMQRLTHARLVEVRQGEGSTVRDVRDAAGPEVLVHLLLRGDRLDTAVARSILEMRALLGPDAARLAAERAGADDLDRLDVAVAALADATDPVARQLQALAFWDAIVDGAANITLRLLFNTLRRAYEPALPALAVVLAAEVSQLGRYREVAAAIRAGDGGRAEAAAADLLAAGTEAIAAALDAVDAVDAVSGEADDR